MTDLVRTDDNGAIALNTQDIASFGAKLSAHGLTQLQVQAFMASLQKMSMQVALSSLNIILEDVRQIQEARFWDIINQLRALPTYAGYVSLDRVIQIIQMTAMKSPRQ